MKNGKKKRASCKKERERPQLTLENTVSMTLERSRKRHEKPRKACMNRLMTVDEVEECNAEIVVSPSSLTIVVAVKA